jgi:hypothetical protein
MSNKLTCWLLCCISTVVFATGCESLKNEKKTMKINEPLDYAQDFCWVTKPATTDKKVDVFYVYPTIYVGADPSNMDISDTSLRKNADGLLVAQASVFSSSANLFAPYYRQQTAAQQSMEAGNGGADAFADPVFQVGAKDVEQAFEYYLKNLNPDRPFILAGHSQGTMALINLMRNRFNDTVLQKRLVAAYLIGYSVTPKDLEEYPWMKLARGETDTGVIITFNTEGENAGPSPVLLPGAHAINPLNWKTDGTLASREANLGAKFFVDATGELLEEIPHFAAAYVDTVKGVLIVKDIQTPKSNQINLEHMGRWSQGVFHRYDYSFWYNNLKTNVKARIDAYQGKSD